ncbi:MAG: ABC transporter permease [Oscillospiraceae bacterium]|nr:ABC transporter permease [Oscillospiraceae bacterium]
MRTIKAIFIKQTKDLFRNPMVLLMFVIFPVVAFFMTQLIAKTNDDISSNMFVTMMASIFIGMGLISSSAGAIAEDIERGSLRFLIIAGVKPGQYLIGTCGFFTIAGSVVSVAFTLIGEFTFGEGRNFLVVMIAGTIASIILGATIGMITNNQQAATSLAVPVAVVTGFIPMFSLFNETIERVASVLYTQQINTVVSDISSGLVKPLIVILLNILVFVTLFVLTYLKKRLKG